MSDSEVAARSHLTTLMLLTGQQHALGINSDALDDVMLDRCFELVLKGLAEEIPGPEGTVWFRVTDRGAALLAKAV